MSIGSTIKRLRREKDITQEQLAEYLGITSRAVSQWECDRTAPDISQIPALCHVLDVSSDTLLGIDITKSNEEIGNYLDRAFEEEKEGNFKGSEEILRDGLRKFPKLADSVTGGGLHGKDLSKADVSVNIYAWMKAQATGKPVELCCAIGDETVDGIPYSDIVETAREFIRSLGGFEKFAEWGLV